MNAQKTITSSARNGGWTVTQHPAASQVTVFTNGDHVVHVGFYAGTGRVASAHHYTPEGIVLSIDKGAGWADRILTVMASAAADPRKEN